MSSVSTISRWLCVVLLTVSPLLAATVSAQSKKTDVVTLANGDHITGEVSGLNRGRLEFSTDDAGTIYVEWDKVARVTSIRFFEVVTAHGQRLVGHFVAGDPTTLVVVDGAATTPLAMADVTAIEPIGRGFWSKIDASVDAGFNYTQSSEVAQLNLNASAVYRRAALEARVTGSATLTENQSDGERDDRGTVQMSFARYRGERWFNSAAGGFESNESLGLTLRSQLAYASGWRLVNSNRSQFIAGGGVSVNREQGLDAEPTTNVEGLLLVRHSYFTYDRPRTNFDFSLQYFPSLSDFGRQRVQLTTSVRREVWKDAFLAVNVFDTYDSRPPTGTTVANTNDVGVSLSFGLTF